MKRYYLLLAWMTIGTITFAQNTNVYNYAEIFRAMSDKTNGFAGELAETHTDNLSGALSYDSYDYSAEAYMRMARITNDLSLKRQYLDHAINHIDYLLHRRDDKNGQGIKDFCLNATDAWWVTNGENDTTNGAPDSRNYAEVGGNGRILTSMADFCEYIYANPSLQNLLSNSPNGYLRQELSGDYVTIAAELIVEIDKTFKLFFNNQWQNITIGASNSYGTFFFCDSVYTRLPRRQSCTILVYGNQSPTAYNRLASMGNAMLKMYKALRAKGDTDSSLYKDKTYRAASYLKYMIQSESFLGPQCQYYWQYSPYYWSQFVNTTGVSCGDISVSQYGEDDHLPETMSFPLQCYKFGIVFTENDMIQFAETARKKYDPGANKYYYYIDPTKDVCVSSPYIETTSTCTFCGSIRTIAALTPYAQWKSSIFPQYALVMQGNSNCSDFEFLGNDPFGNGTLHYTNSTAAANGTIKLSNLPGLPTLSGYDLLVFAIIAESQYYGQNTASSLGCTTGETHTTYIPANLYNNCSITAQTSYTIPTSVSREMVAGQFVNFKPGFSVSSGAAFHAYIDQRAYIYNECGGSLKTDETDGLAGSDTITAVVVGIDTNEVYQPVAFNLYPNPNTGSFTLEYPVEKGKADVRISDLLGKEVYITTLQNNKTEINISGLPKGVYVVKITEPEGYTHVKKIIYQ